MTVDSDGDTLADTFIDLNQNGQIEVSEIANIQELSFRGISQSLNIPFTGLDQFPNLEKISTSVSDNGIYDISSITTLKSLFLQSENQTVNLNLNSVSLETLEIEFTNIQSIDFTNVPHLKEIRIYDTNGLISNLDFTVLTNLEKLKGTLPGITNFNLSSNLNLKEIELDRMQTNVLNFSNNQLLEKITIGSELYFTGMFNGLNLLKEINLNYGQTNSTITSLDLSTFSLLEKLHVAGMINLSSLNLSNNTNLESFALIGGLIPSLDFSINQQLLYLNIESVPQLTALNLNSNILLKEVDVVAENLSSFSLLNNINVEILRLGNVGQNLSINFSSLNNLKELSLGQQFGFSSLDLSSNTNLETLSLGLFTPALSSVDLSNNILLTNLNLIGSNFTDITLDSNPLLDNIYIRYTDLQRINIVTNAPLKRLAILDNDDLEYFTIKNGLEETINTFMSIANQFFFFGRNNSLAYVCVDEIDIPRYINWSNYHGYNNLTINSYCSFTPGGNFNEIQGNISLDIDNNGCDPTDPFFPNFNFTATDGTISGTISSNQLGEYYAPVADGQHTITPNPENPTYWNFSPSNVVVDFPTQASPFTQDFCVTANGTIEDLEVIVVPLEQARPGFDTDYKVVVKNKGNQTASGSVTLEFEENFMTLLSTNPTAGNTPSNQLSWSFNNLAPFQMEEFEYTMTLNTPTQTTNPLNSNDILTFTGTVTGTGTDAMPADNVMVFDQTVVNSYDPNDKTCLEGETIDPADVGEYVHYMIRFENTGTASAINVVIKDEIDLTQFDITTLIPLGGSHDYYTRIREGNVVEFIHENINLDFNDATNDGYVLFKIKTLPALVAGDTFDNTAEIYFDFNFPIITNTETVTVMSTASIGATTDSSIKLFPNPASSFINLTAANRLESATIMDINGRMLSQTNFTGNTTEQRISLENLSAGIYFVTIQSKLGQKVEKLVVE